MIIVFGLALDEPAFPTATGNTGGLQYLGPNGLLLLLEAHLGLSGHPLDNDYLRIEQYRQALRRYLDHHPDAFFAASFQADQFATATDLLSRRDELLLAGWDLCPGAGLPPRLACLVEIEADWQSTDPAPGIADRFTLVLKRLRPGRPPLEELRICDPWALLPAHLQRLFQKLESFGAPLTLSEFSPQAPENCDLGRFQRSLVGIAPPGRLPLQADGSLLLLRGKRETELAALVATLLRRRPSFRPLCLVPDKNRSLDQALIQEGLPSLGIPSASLARPTLQVLKLVTVFLWNPIDPFKVMEFVSLSVKPLDDELANRIAMQIAQTPGIQGEGWQRTIGGFFASLDERARRDRSIDPEAVRRQYRFWFERRRYDSHQSVPREEVIGIFAYLERWARDTFGNGNGKNHSLLVLLDQARRIRELLEALPETQLSQLELERIVRTIYEPAPVQVRKQEKESLPFIYQPHALIGPSPQLLWWNFVQREPNYFFSRWYEPERRYLHDKGIVLEEPRQENERLLWQRRQAILQTGNQLLLVLPEYIDGQPVLPHPLLGDLEARFGPLGAITYTLESEQGGEAWERSFELPGLEEISGRSLGRPAPFLFLRDGRRLEEGGKETFSSLQALFYYPYQWVFRHKLSLRKSSILSIVPPQTLMGNLAHRLFERLLAEAPSNWSRAEIEAWIDREASILLEREGAVLLLYGREPERVSFLRRVKYAAWSLICLMRNNGWEVLATELDLEGHFLHLPISGRADLVLKRGDELAIIDLKWRGAGIRERIIRNEEDLQLVLYSKLISPNPNWAHTAYFILENGRLIARTNEAFREITPVQADADPSEINQRILDKMHATYQWRLGQVSDGRIEVRCAHTQSQLEEEYGEELLQLLEMKREDAPFDDYRTLIYMVD